MSKFTIDARDAGDGGLGFSVEGPSKAELKCVSKDDGTCQVEFLPKAPGVYTIHIKYADQHVPGSPFVCVVAGEDGSIPDEVRRKFHEFHLYMKNSLSQVGNVSLEQLVTSLTRTSHLFQCCPNNSDTDWL